MIDDLNINMIVAISSQDDKLYEHFGRAPEFTFLTIEENKVVKKRVLSNPGHEMGSIPKFIHEQGAKVVIAGGMGPKAINLFQSYDIELYIGISGTINDIIKQFLNGSLEKGLNICDPGSGKGAMHGLEKGNFHEKCDHGNKFN